MIFEDKVDTTLYSDNELPCLESYNINKELLEQFSKNNEFFLTNGVYNFLKHNSDIFLSESVDDYSKLTLKMLDITQFKMKNIYKTTIDVLKLLNKDRKLIDIVINLLTDKDNLSLEIVGEVEDYNYSINKESNYLKYFDEFILTIKSEYIETITPGLIVRLNSKYSTDFFDKLRGKLINKAEVTNYDFPEGVFKYFRSGDLETKPIVINSEAIKSYIEKYKEITDYINLISDEYKRIEKFYSDIKTIIMDQSSLSVDNTQEEDKPYIYEYDKKIYDNKEKVYIDYITLRRSHMSLMLSIYNTYFIEKMLAVKQMYKSYYNRCALYYSKIKYKE